MELPCWTGLVPGCQVPGGGCHWTETSIDREVRSMYIRSTYSFGYPDKQGSLKAAPDESRDDSFAPSAGGDMEPTIIKVWLEL